jgi:hypothetical protein
MQFLGGTGKAQMTGDGFKDFQLTQGDMHKENLSMPDNLSILYL